MTVPEHHDPVPHRHGFHLVVRHIDHGGPEPPVQPGDLRPHLHPELGVQVRERLVEEKHPGLAHDGPPDGHALPLAARELRGLPVQHRHQPQDLGSLLDPFPDLRLWKLAQPEAEGHVLEGRHVRVQRVVLKNHGDVPVLRRHVVDHPVADPEHPFGDRLQPGNHPQHGALAAPGGPDEDDELPVPHLEAGPVHGHEAVVVYFAYPLKRDVCHDALVLNS
ncbi:MAG: hypothetical protein KatS3mg044_1200 [Rhodothermaceae bacterium]|nr:MAG: hypothetical protein KatS3mg044_1200 [Rhodothermaceae bacterium]